MFRLWCILIGYAFGLISSAYIFGKINGIDIRTINSGNAGATNTLRTFGKRAGLIVLVMDLLKSFLAVLIATLIFKKICPDMIYLVKIYTFLGVVFGHDFPFYLKFKGGKGVAVSWGSILMFCPLMLPAQILVFFGIFLLTHLVSLSSLFFSAAFLAQLIIFGQAGFFGLSQGALFELYAIGALIFAISVFVHRENIKRLIKNKERKTYVFKHAPAGEGQSEAVKIEAWNKKNKEDKKSKKNRKVEEDSDDFDDDFIDDDDIVDVEDSEDGDDNVKVEDDKDNYVSENVEDKENSDNTEEAIVSENFEKSQNDVKKDYKQNKKKNRKNKNGRKSSSKEKEDSDTIESTELIEDSEFSKYITIEGKDSEEE